MTRKNIKKFMLIIISLSVVISALTGCSQEEIKQQIGSALDVAINLQKSIEEDLPSGNLSKGEVPSYEGEDFTIINANEPDFSDAEIGTSAFEEYSPLDELGRCQVAYACVGRELMPTEKRGSIGMIKPSGWKTVRYDDLVEGRYLYNRSHLIGYQLTGENANERNLITGTRYFNVDGMLPFENMVAEYVKQTGNHVLYRVTPVYIEDNLVASGVQMEAFSVEDDGAGVTFNVFVHNIQPGVVIDYKTGESRRESEN